MLVKRSTLPEQAGLEQPGTSALMALLLFLCVASSSIVFREPAPTDLLFVLIVGLEIVVFGRIVTSSGSTTADVGLYAFVLANVVSLLFTTDLGASLRYFWITIYLCLFSLYLTHFISETGRAGSRLLFNAYLVAATLSAGIGLLTRFDLMPSAEMFYHDKSGIRIQSTFKDPNVFGPFLIGASLIALDRIIFEARHRFLCAALLFLFAFNIAMTFSRGAYGHLVVSLCIFVGVSMCLMLRADRGFLVILMTFLGGGAMVVAASYLLSQFDLVDFLAKRLGMQRYDEERFGNQLLGLEIFASYPFGIGPGEYNNANFVKAAHNLYLRALVENGVLGLLGLTWFLMVSLGLMIQSILATGAARREVLVCLAVLVGVLGESMVIDTIHWRHLFFFLGMGLGLSSWAARQERVA